MGPRKHKKTLVGLALATLLGACTQGAFQFTPIDCAGGCNGIDLQGETTVARPTAEPSQQLSALHLTRRAVRAVEPA